MIHQCRRNYHNVVERAGYVVCMELDCPDRPVKLPGAHPNEGDKRALANRKKQVRRDARIEEWETYESTFWLDSVTHWMSNPYRRWWQHVLLSPVYLICVLMIIVFAVWVLATTEWA